MAATCCEAQVILRGRALTRTRTTGLPVAPPAASRRLLLPAGKVEGGPGGALAAHGLGFAEDEDGHLRLLDEVEGFVELGVTRRVGLPGGGGAGELGIEDGGLAALDLDAGGVGDVGRGKALAEAFEDGYGVSGVAGEAPGAHDVGFGVGKRADEELWRWRI